MELIFLGFILILFFLPGFFLAKLLFSDKKIILALFVSLGIFFSLAIIPIVFYLISLIKPYQLTLSSTLVIILTSSLTLFLTCLGKPWPKIILPTKKQSIFLSVLIFLSLVSLLAPYFRPHLGPFWSTYHFGVGRDIEKHLGLINGLKIYGLPPKNPFISGLPLNYYYFYHLNAALLSVLSNNLISSELSHLLLSASILIASSQLLSVFLHPFICLILFLGYGFDFFPMIAILLKIRPYQFGLNHLDEWTAPFAPQLKVNPLSVWFAWAPQHSLSLLLALIFIGIFFDQIKINFKFKQISLSFLLLAICGTSIYIFLGMSAIFLIFWVYQCIREKKFSFKNYSFVFFALPFCLSFLIPLVIGIKTPTVAFFPFWQLPRDHLFSWKFPLFPLPIKFLLLVFFLVERFLVYFFDLGLFFILAAWAWKKVFENDFFVFVKIMLVMSILICVLLKSVPFNNDLCYRVSGFSWLACAFIANQQIEKIWGEIKKKKILLALLAIIIFSPTIIEQVVFPYQKLGKEFLEVKEFAKKIPSEAIVQTSPDFIPAIPYLIERRTIYSPSGLIFFPEKKSTEKIKKDVETIFASNSKESLFLIQRYKIDYLLIKNNDKFKASSALEKIFENKDYLIFKAPRKG